MLAAKYTMQDRRGVWEPFLFRSQSLSSWASLCNLGIPFVVFQDLSASISSSQLQNDCHTNSSKPLLLWTLIYVLLSWNIAKPVLTVLQHLAGVVFCQGGRLNKSRLEAPAPFFYFFLHQYTCTDGPLCIFNYSCSQKLQVLCHVVVEWLHLMHHYGSLTEKCAMFFFHIAHLCRCGTFCFCTAATNFMWAPNQTLCLN